jgi:Helix-turn-helix domain
MSVEESRRVYVVDRIEAGELTIAEAAAALGLSRRQMKRLRKKVREDGPGGIVHGNVGRAPWHKTPADLRDRIVQLWRSTYVGFNDQHFTEKLVDVEALEVSRETVRRALRGAGIGAARRRRPPKHRRRRDRRPQAGLMILWDGSRHDWLEERGPRLCLMAAIDDATGELLAGAHFVEQECTIGYLRVLREIVKHHGIPVSAYMDRHGTLKRNDSHWTHEEQLAGRQEPTQVKRALDDLGVHVLYALSPQAKGRVERLWGTLQDRLVSELRLAKVSTAKGANEVLEWYRHEHNKRFAVPAADAIAAWRPLSGSLGADDICALQYARLVRNNNTVKVGHQVIDIPRNTGGRATYARTNVLVRHLLDGGYSVHCEGRVIARAASRPPIEPRNEVRTTAAWQRQRAKVRGRGVTESQSS